jgi:hypothetical protein
METTTQECAERPCDFYYWKAMIPSDCEPENKTDASMCGKV